MKLGRYVHPMVLQKRYAGIVKILIFRHEQDDLFEVDFCHVRNGHVRNILTFSEVPLTGSV